VLLLLLPLPLLPLLMLLELSMRRAAGTLDAACCSPGEGLAV